MPTEAHMTVDVTGIDEVVEALSGAAKMIALMQRRCEVLQGIIDKNSAAIQLIAGETCPHCKRGLAEHMCK